MIGGSHRASSRQEVRLVPRPARRHLGGVGALIVALAAFLLPAAPAFAEGSVDFNTGVPTSNRHLLGMGLESAGVPNPNTNRYSVLRVYARAGETIQMGSSAMPPLSGTAGDISVYAPGTNFASSTEPNARANFPGDPVFGSAIFDCNSDDPGAGRIAGRKEEVEGPKDALHPLGYTPCEFTAPAEGIYPIIMRPYGGAAFGGFPPSTVANPAVGSTVGMAIAIWDVTVRSVGIVQPGRLFSNRLTFSEVGANASDTNAYLYTPSGYEYRIAFFKHAGEIWDMAANDRGVIDSATGGRIFASFQFGENDITNVLAHTEALAPQLSAPDLSQDSRFPIFFREPDPAAISGKGGLAETRGFATAPISPTGALTNLSFTPAGEAGISQSSGGTLTFDSPPQMNGLGYTVAIDANGNGIYGDENDFVDAGGELDAAGINGFAWAGTDANGEPLACGTYGYRVSSTLAEVHLTQSDVEASGGTLIERLSLPTDPALGNPLAASYNEIDPYKGTSVTNAAPSAVTEGISGPSFHAWTANTGNGDFVDTWMRLPEVSSTGSFEVCPGAKPEVPVGNPPPTNPPPPTPPAPEPPAPPTSTPAAPVPPAAKPPKHDKPKPPGKPGKPKLVLKKVASTGFARPSSVLGYSITLWNKGDGAARNVQICDEPPAGLTILRSEPAAGRKGSTCWKLRSLAAGSKRVFRVTAQVGTGLDAGLMRNVATVAAANVKGVKSASASVRVKPLPDRACGSSLERPVFGTPRIAFRC